MSNERWCGDTLEIPCWNGELVVLGFALDCHDRENLAYVAAPRDLLATDIQLLMQRAVAGRFGAGARPDVPIQWLSDNGSIYTALDTLCTAERLHLVPITTPPSSLQSNGMSEAFVNTVRRDYLAVVAMRAGRRRRIWRRQTKFNGDREAARTRVSEFSDRRRTREC